MSGYPIPAQPVQVQTEIKRSRFIARACRATSRSEALAHVEQARHDFPDARHWCWAYATGDPRSPRAVALSDDGEPVGTAGKPILNVIQHKAIGDVIVVVIRYFGGIKLGAGGLIRAYAGAAEAALSALALETREPTQRFELILDFSREQAVRHWASQHGAHVAGLDYGAKVALQLVVPEKAGPALRGFCAALGIVLAELSGRD